MPTADSYERKLNPKATARSLALSKAKKKKPVSDEAQQAIDSALDLIPGARFIANSIETVKGNKVDRADMQSGFFGLVGGNALGFAAKSAGNAITAGTRALGASEPLAKGLALRAITKPKNVAIGFPAENIKGIASSGGFRSGLEVGVPQSRQELARGFNVNPQYREIAEQRALGIPISAPASQRPVYGILTAKKLPLPVPKGSLVDEMQTALSPSNKTIGQYGGAVAVLKPGAAKGATATVGDSAGAFMGANTKIAAPLEDMSMRQFAKAGGGQLVGGFKGARNVADYIETQITPAKATLDNVAKIIAPDKTTQDIIKSALREAGWSTKVKLSPAGKMKLIRDFLQKFEKSPLSEAPRAPLGQRGVLGD